MVLNEETKRQLSQNQIPTQKLNDYPTETVPLPSLGKYYSDGNPLQSGQIELRYPTAREEDILTSKNLIQKGNVIDVFINSLIVDKSINTDDLLLGDKNAIVIASRIMAYGKDYPIEASCPSCGELNKTIVDITGLQSKQLKIDINNVIGNEFEFELPMSKHKIIFKVLTQRDDKSIDSQIKASKKALKLQTGVEITTRLKASIISINGSTDRLEIKNLVDNMLSTDSLALRQHINSVSPDIDMKFDFICSECSHEERMNLPLGIGFFWPSSEGVK